MPEFAADCFWENKGEVAIEQNMDSSKVDRMVLITAECFFIRCSPMLQMFEFKDNSKSFSASNFKDVQLTFSMNDGLTKSAGIHYIVRVLE
ncbi:MAG: hypothetical protein ABIP71_06325 [Verrucomicrobiota bacterium]